MYFAGMFLINTSNNVSEIERMFGRQHEERRKFTAWKQIKDEIFGEKSGIIYSLLPLKPLLDPI